MVSIAQLAAVAKVGVVDQTLLAAEPAVVLVDCRMVVAEIDRPLALEGEPPMLVPETVRG